MEELVLQCVVRKALGEGEFRMLSFPVLFQLSLHLVGCELGATDDAVCYDGTHGAGGVGRKRSIRYVDRDSREYFKL